MPEVNQSNLFSNIKQEIRRRLREESFQRIQKCLDELTEDEVWQRPNPNSNSMGNLVLHLCGNIRQWLLHGIGGDQDKRERQAEFDETGPIPKKELLDKFEKILDEVDVMLDKIGPDILLEKRMVQGYQESGISIIIHVIEHCSYHVGQMAYYVKAIKDLDLKFYRGHNLDTTG